MRSHNKNQDVLKVLRLDIYIKKKFKTDVLQWLIPSNTAGGFLSKASKFNQGGLWKE